MKKIVLIIGFLFFIIGCSKPSDCVESTGDIITKEFVASNFDKIIVYQGIALVVKEGPEYKVEVKTGENLMGDIEVKVDTVSRFLSLKDNTTCNWVREFGLTTVYVTAPNITELHSKTERTISSDGVLTNSIMVDGVLTKGVLRLFSMDLTDGAGTGDFKIQVDNSQLVIENNNVARYYISGQTEQMLLNFYDGNGRFMGENLSAKWIKIFHRGSNDMIVRPIDKIEGDMVSTGNLILKNNPPINLVRELYQGRIIHNY